MAPFNIDDSRGIDVMRGKLIRGISMIILQRRFYRQLMGCKKEVVEVTHVLQFMGDVAFTQGLIQSLP